MAWLNLALALALVAILCGPVRAEPLPDRQPFEEGISFAAWWSGQYSRPEADFALESLAATGADWVSIIVTGYQQTPTSTTIDRTGAATPTDEDLSHAIRDAHQLGLKVMLKPHLDLPNESATGIWRGYIGRDFTSETQWSAWFAAYTDFITHYARLAKAHGVEQFCVGVELLGTTHRADNWRAVVAAVRAVYHGPVIYAALHGGEETSITWWDAVDLIGVDAYYPLTAENWSPDRPDPTMADLVARWQQPINRLAALAATCKKQVVLTEIGYRSHHGCTNHPWESWCSSSVDMQEQASAYEAAFQALYDQPWLAGIFWWTWLADPFASGACDEGYSPHLKAAENILRAWYGGMPLSGPASAVADYDHVMNIYTDQLAPGWQDWSWGAAVNPSATDQVYAGTRSLAVRLEPWGALSLWHASFTSQGYAWLEFRVRRASAGAANLTVFFEAANGTLLYRAPVNDCRHIAGGTINADTWGLVRIPLSYLNRPETNLVRLNIQNASGADATSLWIDDIRLVGAQAPSAFIWLPLIVNLSR